MINKKIWRVIHKWVTRHKIKKGRNDMNSTKVFVDKATGETYIQWTDGKFIALKDLDISKLEELPADAIKKYTYKSYNYVEENLSLEEQLEKDWRMKDILCVPCGGKIIPFRVEHLTDDKVYFVAVDIVGKSAMGEDNSDASVMNVYLDKLMSEMPYELVENMLEIEHGFGSTKERRKLSLLSLANVKADCYKHTGADDILFDGLKTEAERCKNFEGETDWYFLRSPNTGGTINFWNVNYYGYVTNYITANNAYGVVPCFSIKRKIKK